MKTFEGSYLGDRSKIGPRRGSSARSAGMSTILRSAIPCGRCRLARRSRSCRRIGPARPARAWRTSSWWCAMTDALSCRARPVARASRRHFARCTPIGCRGSPLSIAAVAVEAVGFAPWKHYWLGVMLTPWSMNLLLAPRETSAWRSLPPGEKRRYTFPAGTFDFIGAREDAIGEYLICSLFSPLLEFADHATARQTALLAREALFDSANAEAAALPPASTASATASSEVPKPLARLEASLATPMSRRDLLHARFSGNVDEP